MFFHAHSPTRPLVLRLPAHHQQSHALALLQAVPYNVFHVGNPPFYVNAVGGDVRHGVDTYRVSGKEHRRAALRSTYMSYR